MSALRAFGRVVGRMAVAPLRLIDRVLVGDSGSPQEIPEVRPYDNGEATDSFDRQAIYAEVANRIMTWAADSVVAGRPVPLAARDIPIDLREWLPGLTRDECLALIRADEKAVSAHLQQMFPLPGVRPVQRLPRLQMWPAEPSLAFDEGSPGFLSYATDAGWPVRSRARARIARS
ncbi:MULTISPECIES: hypothetical protein [unclassified Bradyrhizobium]|uniref:hypothetical protein n=1 Tax=unclassified Bradyrhizobium TaxID=2631580 RepID=UPI002FF2FEBD